MRERRDKRQNLSILFLKCPKIDNVQSSKLPRMHHWWSKKPKMTNTKMINTKKKFPRKKASHVYHISTYAMIAYLNSMMIPTKMIVKLNTYSLTRKKQSLTESMIFLRF